MSEVRAMAGINPATGKCSMVAEVCPEAIQEAMDEGLIIVPVSVETARTIFGERVEDILSIAVKP